MVVIRGHGAFLVSGLQECDDLVAETFCPPGVTVNLSHDCFGSRCVHSSGSGYPFSGRDAIFLGRDSRVSETVRRIRFKEFQSFLT